MLAPDTTAHRLLDDPDLEASFQDVGFATFPVLPEHVAAALLADVQALYPDGRAGITFANVDEDRAFIRALDAVVKPYWDPFLAPLVPRHRVVFTTCVVKHPDSASAMSSHEDGTFVDESTARAVTVWIPLSDCLPDNDNGMIRVLPRSHRVVSTLAGANVPEWHRPHREFLSTQLTGVPTRAGHAVAWDSRLLHGSGPNRSDEPRFALIAVLVPRSAPLIHVEALGRTRRRAFAVDDAFHLDHSPIAVRHVMPTYPELRRFEEPVEEVSADEIAALCGARAPMPVSSRPSDDWCPLEAGRRPPVPGRLPPNVDGDLDDLCEAALLGVRELLALGSGLIDQRADDVVALRAMGGWGAVALVRDGRPVAQDPLRLASQRAGATPCRAATVFALEPGSSLLLALDHRRSHWVLPLTLPPAPAGVATDGGSAEFELGHVIELPPTEQTQFWNESNEQLRWVLLDDGDPSLSARARARWARLRVKQSGRTGRSGRRR